MAVNGDGSDGEKSALFDAILSNIRQQYVEEHDEEPPEEYMQEARQNVLRAIGKNKRDENREIYDELAKE